MEPLVYTFPEPAELREIEQELLPVVEADDPVFFGKLFPTENADTVKLEWEQRDNFSGLQQARGLDGQPAPVQKLGFNRFSTEPGVYGEYVPFDEEELTRKREMASYTGMIDLTAETAVYQQLLLQRRVDRQRWLGWTLLCTGQFVVPAPNSGYVHRDQYTFPTLTLSPGLSDFANSKPLDWFLEQFAGLIGTSAVFDGTATVYVNAVTMARLLRNTNAADLGGRFRVNGGDTLNTLEDVNKLLLARNLPQFEVYDKFWMQDRSTPVRFIPNGVGILLGKRPGNTPLGGYRMVRNVNNPNMAPGAYTKVIDTIDRQVPRTVGVHDGHNGGPYIMFPSMVRILQLG